MGFGLRELLVFRIEVDDAGKVAGIADIHRVGKCLLRCLWRILPREQILIEDVVGVVGCNESLHGQSHLVSEQRGTDVSEIAAWHTYDKVTLLPTFLLKLHGLRNGVEVVERLGEEASHVDAVGRRELHVAAEFFVHEGILHQCLTIVENAVYLNGGDVPPECCKLALLNLAHLSFGIEDVDVYALYTEESIGNGRTCVATCCNKHVDGGPFRLIRCLDKVLQESRHEAGTNILEGQRRAMKELQRIDVVLHLDDGGLERKRVADNLLQGFCLDIFSEKSLGHLASNLLERHLGHLLEKLLG